MSENALEPNSAMVFAGLALGNTIQKKLNSWSVGEVLRGGDVYQLLLVWSSPALVDTSIGPHDGQEVFDRNESKEIRAAALGGRQTLVSTRIDSGAPYFSGERRS